MRAECSGDGGAGARGPRRAARASVCIRHIYPDSGRAGSLTRPNARPAYVGRDAHAVSLVPPHRTPMQKANTVRQVGNARFFSHLPDTNGLD
ncbi:jg19826 [Pararge aegeria aegeria]|uniref:Jg19826 protein n=1 Tax=Pararge aegeria aegeria TaxID=348720 RepID=A0A8S4SDN4_9NEOP|nr:jg19826 [Pararge aegeria aegeria]